MKIGFIGLGQMGAPMARRLLSGGHELVVLDTQADAVQPFIAGGALAARTPREVADAARVIFACLPTTDAVKQVACGDAGVAGGAATRIFIDLSTTDPERAARIAQQLAGRSIAMLDSPVSGGVPRAEAGTLTVMVSGAKQTLDEVRGLLESFGTLHHLGETPGSAQVMKLINNLLSATAFTVTAEAMVMGVKAGLGASQMLQVLNSGTGRNTATEYKFPDTILPRTFKLGAATSVLLKDVSLCAEQAARLGLELSLAQPILDLWEQVAKEQGSDSDYSEIVKMLERRAGVEVNA